MWRVHVPTKVRKELRRSFPVEVRERIQNALRNLERDGIHATDVRHLIRNEYRKRVGSYRILFRAHPSIRFIQVQRIARRTSTTYRKR